MPKKPGSPLASTTARRPRIRSKAGACRPEHHPLDLVCVVLDEGEQPRSPEHDVRFRERGPRLRPERPVDPDDGHDAARRPIRPGLGRASALPADLTGPAPTPRHPRSAPPLGGAGFRGFVVDRTGALAVRHGFWRAARSAVRASRSGLRNVWK